VKEKKFTNYIPIALTIDNKYIYPLLVFLTSFLDVIILLSSLILRELLLDPGLPELYNEFSKVTILIFSFPNKFSLSLSSLDLAIKNSSTSPLVLPSQNSIRIPERISSNAYNNRNNNNSNDSNNNDINCNKNSNDIDKRKSKSEISDIIPEREKSNSLSCWGVKIVIVLFK